MLGLGKNGPKGVQTSKVFAGFFRLLGNCPLVWIDSLACRLAHFLWVLWLDRSCSFFTCSWFIS